MKPTHESVTDKPFDYVNLDKAFLHFASEDCGDIPAEDLIESIERTIAAHHDKATPKPLTGHSRMIWELENEHVVFKYQVLQDRIEIGDIVSKKSGLPYEPYHDLHATWTP